MIFVREWRGSVSPWFLYRSVWLVGCCFLRIIRPVGHSQYWQVANCPLQRSSWCGTEFMYSRRLRQNEKRAGFGFFCVCSRSIRSIKSSCVLWSPPGSCLHRIKRMVWVQSSLLWLSCCRLSSTSEHWMKQVSSFAFCCSSLQSSPVGPSRLQN